VDQLATLRPEKGKYSEKELALLDYVKVLTLEPANVRDTHVERLRKLGWSDEQVFEASFITALFAFFNRMADAYGLDYPANGWLPEDLRSAKPGQIQAAPIPSRPGQAPIAPAPPGK
jgi:hypothetical protein